MSFIFGYVFVLVGKRTLVPDFYASFLPDVLGSDSSSEFVNADSTTAAEFVHYFVQTVMLTRELLSEFEAKFANFGL